MKGMKDNGSAVGGVLVLLVLLVLLGDGRW